MLARHPFSIAEVAVAPKARKMRALTADIAA
jgi:hypothetical protein